MDTNGGKITVLGDFTISLENMERISKINKGKVKFFVAKIDNEDVLVSKNNKGDLLGIYSEKSSEGISQISFLKGQIVYPQVETYLNVRSAPNSKGAIVAEAYPEDALTVLEVLDGWVKVSLNGIEGYVSSDYVK